MVAERLRCSRWAEAYAFAKQQEAEVLARKNKELMQQSEKIQSLNAELTAREGELRLSRSDLEVRVHERTNELSQTVRTLNERSEQLRRMTAELTLAEQRETSAAGPGSARRSSANSRWSEVPA